VKYVVEVKKRKGESTEALLRRFHKRVQRSGILARARRLRFFERPKSKRRRQEEATRRAEIQKEKERLRKLGKIEPSDHYYL